ncbi:recombinase family protein [Yoonia sp.]|uniref:recombinase family protein n=1 Tax=Yoonia sp. TaxID=2212373 RepID=UPI00232C0909|nr:recombinase family protein [Yoonia sp.]MDB4241046.1 recombinase family protein [Yoonia sp.]
MQAILYARVSTADQTIDHQRAHAEAAGIQIDRVIEDDGVSGVKTTFADRPGGARLLDVVRGGDVVIVRWVDRLGRDYADVTDTIRTLMRKGVIVRTVINGMTFDGSTSDPMQAAVRDALIGFMAATAQAQAEATKAAQAAGIAHAKATDDKAFRGRKPSYTRDQFDAILTALGNGDTVSGVARDNGVSRQTVLRIRNDRAAAETALTRWGM